MILFPELEKLMLTLHMLTVSALLSKFLEAIQIKETKLTHMKKAIESITTNDLALNYLNSHIVPFNTPTRLFYEEYDCQGRVGLQKEEILASYR